MKWDAHSGIFTVTSARGQGGVGVHISSLFILMTSFQSSWVERNALWETGLRRQSRKESEVFGWSRIPNNNMSRIFCPTPEVQLNHFLHHTPTLRIPVEMVHFF